MKLKEIRQALLARNFDCQPIERGDGAKFFKPTTNPSVLIIADEEAPAKIHLTRIIDGEVLVGEFEKTSPELIDQLQHAILNHEEVTVESSEAFPTFLQMEMLTTTPENN
jgi:hypothetical protein